VLLLHQKSCNLKKKIDPHPSKESNILFELSQNECHCVDIYLNLGFGTHLISSVAASDTRITQLVSFLNFSGRRKFECTVSNCGSSESFVSKVGGELGGDNFQSLGHLV
jgi:hypothetical protein